MTSHSPLRICVVKWRQQSSYMILLSRSCSLLNTITVLSLGSLDRYRDIDIILVVHF